MARGPHQCGSLQNTIKPGKLKSLTQEPRPDVRCGSECEELALIIFWFALVLLWGFTNASAQTLDQTFDQIGKLKRHSSR